MGLDNLISDFQHAGCSPFFISNALQSTFFGEQARQHQAEMMESNIEFREYLQGLRNEYSRARLDAQKQFRRESYELGRQFLIQQTIAQNESRQKQIEFRDFISHYWPLNIDVYTMLTEQQDLLKGKRILPLNVFVAKTELTSNRRDPNQYGEFCESLIAGLRELPNVAISKCPWKGNCQSRLSEAMNINYIMSGIPTLVVFPYQMGSTVCIETASWSFARGLQSMSHKKLLKLENVDNAVIGDTVCAAVKATIGMTRDAYMLAEYHAPVVFNSIVDADILAIPALKDALIDNYRELHQLVQSNDFKQLCLPDELKQIESSLTNHKLIPA